MYYLRKHITFVSDSHNYREFEVIRIQAFNPEKLHLYNISIQFQRNILYPFPALLPQFDIPLRQPGKGQ